MSKAERDAQRKLLMLQGALYRLEITETRAALQDAAKPRAMVGQAIELLKFVLAHKRMSLLASAVPWVLGKGRGRKMIRRTLVAVAAATLAWLFLRRRSQS